MNIPPVNIPNISICKLIHRIKAKGQSPGPFRILGVMHRWGDESEVTQEVPQQNNSSEQLFGPTVSAVPSKIQSRSCKLHAKLYQVDQIS